ncbi:hypothetical protein O9992_18905 [Vibrio lentus]|nr:hypothetical protein [Vibrio lentus]
MARLFLKCSDWFLRSLKLPNYGLDLFAMVAAFIAIVIPQSKGKSRVHCGGNRCIILTFCWLNSPTRLALLSQRL